MYRTALTLVLSTTMLWCRAQTPGDLDLSFSGDGIATTDFGPNGSELGMSVAIQPDGRIVVAGSTQDLLSTQTVIALARYMPDGGLDASFGTGGRVVTTVGTQQDGAMAVALQPDGKIVVVGFSWENGSGDRFLIARYTADGVLDPSFGSGGVHLTTLLSGGRLVSVEIQADGYIVAGGYVDDSVTGGMFIAARYTPDGIPDTTFDGDGFATIDITSGVDQGADIALEPGGGVLVVGAANVGTTGEFALVRLDANGAPDNSLDGDGILVTPISTDQDFGYSVVRQPADGKILVCGASTSSPFVFMVVVRYNTDGTLDNSFAGDGIYLSPHPGLNFARRMVLAPDGRIVLGGTWATNFLVAVVNPDGTADASFSVDGVVNTSFGTNGYGNDIALQADGKAVLVGGSNQGDLTYNDFVVLRYHTGLSIGISESANASPGVLRVGMLTDVMPIYAPKNGTLRVFDLAGQLVMETRVVVGQQSVAVSMLAPGAYVVTLGAQAVRVVKE